MAVSNRPILYSSDIVTRALINVLYQQLLHARLAEFNVHCFSQACFRGGEGKGKAELPTPPENASTSPPRNLLQAAIRSKVILCC